MDILSAIKVEKAKVYNEAEVRFHIMDPIIRHLGYPDRENVYLNLEEKLEYPYAHIGRRSKKDMPLGFPDYRAGLKGKRGSFIVEAKSGSAPIREIEVEQAHSYAAHAQVGANYFVLCNGIEIRIYETLSGPNTNPLVQINLEEINKRFHEIENILPPENLARNCRVQYDKKLKLCDGVSSAINLRSGIYEISDYEYRVIINGEDQTEEFKKAIPQLSLADQQFELLKNSFELRVSEGIAERDDDGRIAAHVKFSGVTKHSSQAMQIMGLDHASFVTADKFISTSPENPTIFESIKDFSLPKGSQIPQMFGDIITMENDISGEVFIRVAMYLEGDKLKGQYLSISEYAAKIGYGVNMLLEFYFSGLFEIKIDT